MSRLIFRINPHTDGDIIRYLEKQPNRSDAIRQAIRAAIAKEEAVNKMLIDMSSAEPAAYPVTVEQIAAWVLEDGQPIDSYLWLLDGDDEENRRKIQEAINAKTNP